MKIVVIIPTYNERPNIGRLIDELQREFVRIPHDMSILVVDDDSPDGTAEVVRERCESHTNVHLLSGHKTGLGDAYVRGMHHAMNELNANCLVQMDADFSHSPTDVPRLIDALENGADFVIGSRYVEGGSVPVSWGLRRRFISSVANRVMRATGQFSTVQDCTGGIRAIRVSLLRNVDLLALGVSGFAFQIALLRAALLQGAIVREMPVIFSLRAQGKSKLRLWDMVEFLLLFCRIVHGSVGRWAVQHKHGT